MIWVVEGVPLAEAASDDAPKGVTLTPGLLIDVAARYIRELGIKPLGPDEERPDSFYLTNHFFGTSARGARAVVRKKHRET